MVAITEDIIQEITARIVEHAKPVKVVLFGSCARGEIGRDSDVDLLVIEDKPFTPEHPRSEEASKLYDALSGLGVAVDLLVFSEDEAEYWRDATNHVVWAALREGKTVYERP
jgi:predicted nucleotidyltransferase